MNGLEQYNRFEYFINRELSWLEFNYRVLEEAMDRSNPLFERLKFCAIFSSNLDEFFMVRVGGLKDQMEAGYRRPDASGLAPKEQIKAIADTAHQYVISQYQCYKRALIPALRNHGIEILNYSELAGNEQDLVEDFYHHKLYPVLTPMAYDPSHPMPLVTNKTLNFAVELIKDGEDRKFAVVQVPTVFPRLKQLPSRTGARFILLEEIMRKFLSSLFKGYRIKEAILFRITRNADFELDEEGAEDLLVTIAQKLAERKRGKIVRLELEHKVRDSWLLSRMVQEFSVKKYEIYEPLNPLDLTFLFSLVEMKGFPDLRYKPFEPRPVYIFGSDPFETIRKQDVFVQHPYDSFDPIVQIVQKAAEDRQVLAIKQILYRVSGDSPIVKALARAAENGKQVSVLVELKARFDEQSNITWARTLEKAGCHVVYGVIGFKTHAKVLLIVRNEDDGIRRYVHLGTGNYNDKTARLYTDSGIFTCVRDFGADVTDFFNMITGYSQPGHWRKLVVAPLNLRQHLIELMQNEINKSTPDNPGRIIAKMNSLVDTEIISMLYHASSNHVKVDLIVRGICCLRPGIKGVSENIRVHSIVGRFLEHSRAFYFRNGGDPRYFLSSADWMPRNLNRRIELMFPLESPESKRRLQELLDFNLRDTIKARVLHPDGKWIRIDKRRKQLFDAQEAFCEGTGQEATTREIVFQPKFEISAREN